MLKDKKKKYPPISIIIVTLNAQRTLESCLRYIKLQTYPRIDEVLIIDGGSTDSTSKIASKPILPIKFINGGYKDNQEARRAIGIDKSRNEICVFIDSDNYIVDKNWLMDMVQPLMEDKNIIASQTLRYSAPRNASLLNRYFGLLGGADPVAYYLGKNDRLSWASNRWNLLGKVIQGNDRYLIVEFDSGNFPTVGANGIVFRRSILLKSNWGDPENFFHTDVFVDIARLGFTRFAIIKNEIFHNTADNIKTFFGKRRKYMELYHQKLNEKRRYHTFNSKNFADLARLFLFIFFTFTIVEPLFESIRGYLKKRDIAWFLHPIICLGIVVVYFESAIYNLARNSLSYKKK